MGVGSDHLLIMATCPVLIRQVKVVAHRDHKTSSPMGQLRQVIRQAIQLIKEILIHSTQPPARKRKMELKENHRAAISTLRTLLRLFLQILIKPLKPHLRLAYSKPAKGHSQQSRKLLAMRESRATGSRLTVLEAEEMVAGEEQGDGAAPFELMGGVILRRGVRASWDLSFGWWTIRTMTEEVKDIPSSWTASLSPGWREMGGLWAGWGEMERMGPWVQLGRF
jgi:hypothetical protein